MSAALRVTLGDTERCVGPDLAASRRSLAEPVRSLRRRWGEGWCPGYGSLEKRSAAKRRPYMNYIVPAKKERWLGGFMPLLSTALQRERAAHLGKRAEQTTGHHRTDNRSDVRGRHRQYRLVRRFSFQHRGNGGVRRARRPGRSRWDLHWFLARALAAAARPR